MATASTATENPGREGSAASVEAAGSNTRMADSDARADEDWPASAVATTAQSDRDVIAKDRPIAKTIDIATSALANHRNARSF